MASFRRVVVAMVVAPVGAASAFVITPMGANAGNGYYSILGLHDVTGGDPRVTQDFTSGGPTDPNHLGEDFWGWRVRGVDTREYVFGQGVSGSTAVFGSFVGNLQGTLDTGGMNYTASGPGYFFTAQQRYTIKEGSLGPMVERTMRITNNSGQALPISVYSFLNLNVNAEVFNGYMGPAGEYRFTVTDTKTGDVMSYEATLTRFPGDTGGLVARFQGGDAVAMRALMTDGSATVLNDTTTGSNGDFAGIFQWDLFVAPGSSVTVRTDISFIPGPGAGALALAGLVVALRRRRE